MKNILLLLLIIFTSLSFDAYTQTEVEKYGCKYIHSKIKTSAITDEEMKYANELTFRSDTFDIINYRIKLDATDFSTKVLVGQCDIDFATKMDNIDYIRFDLLQMTVDSVKFSSASFSFTYKSPFLDIKFDSSFVKGDTQRISVFYHGVSVIDPSGFGGFYFEKGYAYNLGIGLSSIPHNYGRSWFPCFDNFVERSTYDLDIITKPYHTAYCVGEKIGIDTLADNRKIYHYRMGKQIPTYLVGVAVSQYDEVNWSFEGEERDIPIQLVCNPEDTNSIKTSMAYVPFAIEALEKWFGPYQWSRVGYVLTSHGAMEHPTNIAFPDFLGKGGKPEDAMSTMSHELAHHWWGDITTLTTAYDMWIKEGTSEYGHHLFIEHFFGEDRFKKVIKANQLKVLQYAHVEDDGFWALSGMPMNHTYGTTTYNKGAAVIHNLRSYMGDSLFKQGMRSILENYRYSHIDAEQFEKQLEDNTGLDLTCFFNDWIYAPGFCAFEIDSVSTTVEGNEYKSKVFIEQKLYHAPHFYCNVPLEISFYNDEGKKETRTVLVSDQYSAHEIILPFSPKYWTINDDQKLNIGQLSSRITLNKNSKKVAKYAKISFQSSEEDKDSISIYSEHVWAAPDTINNNNLFAKLNISKTHYWNILGDFSANNKIKATFFYSGKKENDLDYLLTHNSEDSIMVLFRNNSRDNWSVFENYKKQKFSPKDGNGIIKITGLKSGQYCFANIEQSSTKTNEFDYINLIYPNPTSDYININPGDNEVKELSIYSVYGNKVYSDKYVKQGLKRINTKSFSPGIYFVLIKSYDSETKVGKFIIK